MNILITLDGIDDIADYLKKLDQGKELGLKRALDETANFIRNHYLSSMEKATKQNRETLLKAIRVTLKGSRRGGNQMMFVWAGANKIPFHYLGNVNQSGKNVVVNADSGTHIVPDAFIITRNGRQMVFKRQTSRTLPIKKKYLALSPNIQREIKSNSPIFQNFFIRSLKRHVFKQAN